MARKGFCSFGLCLIAGLFAGFLGFARVHGAMVGSWKLDGNAAESGGNKDLDMRPIGTGITWVEGVSGKAVHFENVAVKGEETGKGDGSKKTFNLRKPPVLVESENIKAGEAAQTRDKDYTINNQTGEVTFNTPPGPGVTITADYTGVNCLLLASSDAIMPASFTWELWVKPKTFSGDQAIIKKGDGAYSLGIGGENFIFGLFSPEGKGIPLYGSGGNYIEGQWYHIAMTYAGRKMQLYVNGKLENSNEFAPESYKKTTHELLFGAYVRCRAPFEGDIDEIRFYDEVVPESKLGYHEFPQK